MKRVWIGLALLTAFIVVHGTWTFRLNHQRAFAQAVEKKIDIETVHVAAVSGVLILSGRASKEQSDYAEQTARIFLERFAKKAINPPNEIRNEIQIESRVTKSRAPLSRAASDRSVASVPPASTAPPQN